MKCPECQFENREGVKFCEECGAKFELECPACKANIPLGRKFCGECGYNLIPAKEISEEKSETESLPSRPSTKKSSSDVATIEGERKHVTVLFSDLTGYTAMSEKLDPEEVKEITSRIFGEISKIVDKYDGFIEKYAGDAVMALFGVPKAHEDDPIRAVKAAREIHELVDAVSPEVENRIGKSISMHTGINTGLVVTGEVDMERGTHGVAGDTINLTSRLSSLAKRGEILVGQDTFRQAEGHFIFESLEPTMVKGKADLIQVHKVLSPKEKPITIHRLSGLRADLIGRKAEIVELEEAVEKLREGKDRIFSICGGAGAGKSRLVEDFKATLNLDEIQWIEGHAYAYSQNIPYFPIIDLLNRIFQIEEDDPPENVREKIESGIEHLTGKKEDVAPYVGGLYSLRYPEVEEVSPEFWRSRLQEAIQAILSAIAKKAPTIFFLEDLHWADPSFVELLRCACLEIRQPAIVLCVYRPTFSLFTSHQASGIGKIYKEIRLQDLSASEAQYMLESLLKTEAIPSDLRRFVQDKAEGNPFYLEEMVNSLIESETLIRDNESWAITKPISESDISSTIHGVISGRVDRLEAETKRILQEASVIGRAFLYEILKRITELKQDIDRCLRSLEQLDLIRTRSLLPELEYVFKHALTQDAVYSGLLKKERKEIHERIACVMERLFHDRLPEFYETLSFHFALGQSLTKAIDYLIKSGEKSVGRYALEEAHQHYKKAFELITEKLGNKEEKERKRIDVLIKWAEVYHLRGAYRGLIELLEAHEGLAKFLRDKLRLGMFYGWLGYALRSRMRLMEGYNYLRKALEFAEEIEHQKLTGYACAWLAVTCADLGFLDEAISYGNRAYDMSELLQSDQRFLLLTLNALGTIYYMKGDSKKFDEFGKTLLIKGEKESNIRFIATGHHMVACSCCLAGDHPSAIESWEKAIRHLVDPIWLYHVKCLLAISYLHENQLEEAENVCQEIVRHSETFGTEVWGTAAQGLLGIISITKGNLGKGVRILKHNMELWLESGSKYRYIVGCYLLGKTYMEIAQGGGQKNFSFLIKNIGFLIKNFPFAQRKAQGYFNKAIDVSKQIGSNGILGQVYLDLGLFYKGEKKAKKARKCICDAIDLFKQCNAYVYQKKAEEVLTSLE